MQALLRWEAYILSKFLQCISISVKPAKSTQGCMLSEYKGTHKKKNIRGLRWTQERNRDLAPHKYVQSRTKNPQVLHQLFCPHLDFPLCGRFILTSLQMGYLAVAAYKKTTSDCRSHFQGLPQLLIQILNFLNRKYDWLSVTPVLNTYDQISVVVERIR